MGDDGGGTIRTIYRRSRPLGAKGRCAARWFCSFLSGLHKIRRGLVPRGLKTANSTVQVSRTILKGLLGPGYGSRFVFLLCVCGTVLSTF